MNQKAYSVLFCALLASTFVHELRAKGVAPVSSRLGVFERAASTEICELECSFNITNSFGLTIQVVGDILVIINVSANVALLIDVTAQIIVLLNGNTGGGVAIDINAQTGVYIKSGLWVSATLSIEAYLKTLTGGLKAILTLSGAISFKIATASTAILEVINVIVVKLVANIDADVKADIKIGLQIIVTIAGGLITLIRGSLKGLLTIIASGVIQITNDLAGLLNALQGFALIVVKIKGSLTAVIEAGVKFDLELILSASTGLQVLINILLQIGVSIDIGASLGGVLTNPESLFKLLAQLGGNVSIGISGALLVVANIIGFINKTVTLEVLIGVIIQFVAYSSATNSGDLNAAFIATLEGFLLVIKRINATASLSALVTIIQALIAGKYVFGGVNISIIIQKLLNPKSVKILLELVVLIVLELQAIVEIAILIPTLVLVLIFRLNSAFGVKQLIALGISIQVNLGGVVGGVLNSILSGVVSLLLALLTGNFYDALIKLPGIGAIIIALNGAIEVSSSGKISLKALLNAAATIKSLILGLIQVVTGISLGASSAVVAQVQTLLTTTSSVSASLNLNVTLSASASGSIGG